MSRRHVGFRAAGCFAVSAIGLACGGSDGGPDEDPPSAAGDTLREARPGEARAIEPQPSRSYGCNREYRFVARIEEDGETVRLILPDTTAVLTREPSASGAKYSGSGFRFWSRGDEASLDTPERSYSRCVSDAGGPGWVEVEARGADFRAIGQEPGWILDVYEGDSIAVMVDYGAAHHRFPVGDPEPGAEGDRITYRTAAPGHRAEIVILDRACRDAMSGWPYEATVTLTLDGREYRGCGRWL